MRKITRIRSKICQFEKVFFLFLIDANSCPAMGPILTGFCLETSLGHRLKQRWRKRESIESRHQTSVEWGIRNGNERNNFIYTSPPLLPCKQDLPAGNEMRGNLSHAKNGRGIKFSLPILSPGKKKQSYILRGRTPPIYGGAPSGFCENSIFLSHLLSPPVKVERSVGLALRYRPKRKDNFRIV